MLFNNEDGPLYSGVTGETRGVGPMGDLRAMRDRNKQPVPGKAIRQMLNSKYWSHLSSMPHETAPTKQDEGWMLVGDLGAE